MAEKKSTQKKRHWAFVLYPDSAPTDWKDRITQTGLLCAISPLHDKDLNPTGEPKKSHYHIILSYSGPTTYNVVSSLTASLNSTIPIPLEAVKGMYRYFTHIDNPEKYQYDEKEIIHLNGFNPSDFCELSKGEVQQLMIKIQGIIRDFDIIEYAELMDLLLDSNAMLEYDVASSHTFFFDRYISSRRHRTPGERSKEDQHTTN